MDYYGRRELGEQDLVRELDEYYDERGWNPADSHPTPEKLEELGFLICNPGCFRTSRH